MVDVYSPVLGAALAMVVGTIVCAISARVSHSEHLLRLVRVGAVLTLVALALAVTSHVRIGHTPGTETALGLFGFVAEHPMVALLALPAVAFLVWVQRTRRGNAS